MSQAPEPTVLRRVRNVFSTVLVDAPQGVGAALSTFVLWFENWLLDSKKATYGVAVARIGLSTAALGILASNFSTRLYTWGAGGAWSGDVANPRSDFPHIWLFSAPGFRDVVLSTSVRTGADLAAHNPNYVGGDILAGEVNLRQLLFRPGISLNPWATSLPGVYVASASTAPGPAVHGMAGYHAARLALDRDFGIREIPDLSVRDHPRGFDLDHFDPESSVQ